ncbi:MAG TPA: hypothetical protein VL523_20410 [Terriglobia bacterium]|nr:hypothetical protein [Terriglobia bacterium]
MRTSCVERPSEVSAHVVQFEPPEVIFTAVEPADGTWSEVVDLARGLGDPPVIVASRVVDVKLYLDTLDGGAFDFVAAPFNPRDLSYVVNSALSRSHSPVDAELLAGVVA